MLSDRARWLSVCVAVCLSACPPCLSVFLCVCLSVSLSACPLSVCLPVLSVSLYLCLCVFSHRSLCSLQALVCSCFIPIYCGIIPPFFRGVVCPSFSYLIPPSSVEWNVPLSLISSPLQQRSGMSLFLLSHPPFFRGVVCPSFFSLSPLLQRGGMSRSAGQGVVTGDVIVHRPMGPDPLHRGSTKVRVGVA